MPLPNLKDALVKNTRALPASASSSVTSTGIDLMNGPNGQFLANADVRVAAPAVNATMAPDTRTFTYDIVHSVNADLSSPATLFSGLIVQTGASSAGAAAAEIRVRLPTNVRRYIGLKITSGASTGDASAVSATLELCF